VLGELLDFGGGSGDVFGQQTDRLDRPEYLLAAVLAVASDSREASDVATALRATSSTAVVISLTAVAACWISSFC